jgi:antirestriction protein ArdC
MSKTTSPDVYSYVTERIIARLEQGQVPWVNTMAKPLLMARSATTGKIYRGINTFLLGSSPFGSAFWTTYKTAQSMGGIVKHGEKSSLCVFWKRYETKEVDEETGKRKVVPMLKYFNVFNLDQCEGVKDPLLDEVNIPDPIAKADEVIEAFTGKPAVTFGSCNRAFYVPSEDRIVMPQQTAFKNPADMYRTYFHELIHSTGHASRLNRFVGEKVDMTGYGMEELVAELGAAILMAECGIFEDTAEKAASYCQHWITELKGDSKLIVRAAGKAQKAVDLILGRKYENNEGEAAPVAAPVTELAYA